MKLVVKICIFAMSDRKRNKIAQDLLSKRALFETPFKT